MRSFVLASCCSLAVAASASASFQGFSADTYQFDPASGKWVLDLYACYSTTADVLLNIYDANIVITGGGFGSMVHNDLAGGSWCPQLTSNPECDSFVTIGGQPNFGNSTNADPGWGAEGCIQPSIPQGSGWFNSNPFNLQGQAQNVLLHDGSSKIATWIGRFVTNASIPTHLIITASQSNNQGIGTLTSQSTASGDFAFCPSPGAMAVLGLAGLARRRRRA